MTEKDGVYMGLIDFLGALADGAMQSLIAQDDENVNFDILDLRYNTPIDAVKSNYKISHQAAVRAGLGDGALVKYLRKRKDLDIEKLTLLQKAGFGNDLEMVFRDAQVAVLHVFLQLFVLLVMFAMISHDSCHIVHDGELRRGTAHVGALLHLRDALLSEHWCMRMRY